MEGLQTLKKTVEFNTLLLGGSPQRNSAKLMESLKHDLEVDLYYLG